MKYVINTLNKKSKINKEIYGHFSEHLGRCIYEGLFVGEKSEIPNVNGMRTDVVNALKALNIPVLRWPGGCFADEYHWKDGIGKQEERKTMINTHWGGLTEDNSFGTHEFMELCQQLETEPYINGNVGSGTVREMQEWVEYMTSDNVSPMTELRKKNGREKPWKVKYFGIGNETWGCGGNMRPEYAADLHRRYQTYVRNYGDNQIFKIASGANEFDFNWTEVFMKNAKNFMNGISLHYYTVLGPWDKKGSATQFTKSDWYKTLQLTLRMDELLIGHSSIMDKYDPDKKVGLVVDEWGTWFDVEVGTNPGFLFQQNTMRDALVAGINLNIFNKHSDRVCMANIAQTVNVLQAVILTEGEKMLLTPTYHVFEMYKHHQNATLVDSFIETKTTGIDEFKVPKIHESCSINEKGELIITLCNLSLDECITIDTEILGNKYAKANACILTGNMDDYNTFDNVDKIKIEVFEKYNLSDKGLTVEIPACSVVTFILA